MVLTATGSGNALTQPGATTNASGVATGSLSSTVAEAKTVSATITGTAVTQTATVTVTAGSAVSASLSTVSASPTTLTAGSGSATITVTQAPVATVTLSPSEVTIVAGAQQQLTATLKDARNNDLSGRLITWTSNAPDVATVDGTGLVSSRSAGSATITASSEGQSGSVLVTVVPVSVASVSVTLASSSVIAGQTTQATATTKDANDIVLTGRVVHWSSDNIAVAIVSATGLVAALTPGTARITAESEGKTGFEMITVTRVPVASLTVAFAAQRSRESGYRV